MKRPTPLRLAFLSLLLATLPLNPLALAIEDTPENRAAEAGRYLKATPPADMFADMAEQMAKNLPEDQRKAFKDVFTKHLDIPALTKAMKDAMVKHFTAEELKALADFYGSEVGKSAMSKFGTYMAEVMPTIQREAMSAQAKASKSQAEESGGDTEKSE